MLKNQISGKNDSWAIRWYMSTVLDNMLSLYPSKSYVQNIGFDSSGTNCGINDNFQVVLSDSLVLNKIDINEDIEARKKIIVFFNSSKVPLLNRYIFRVKNMLWSSK
jgi:hypothetical protein